jgi:hypothetical protein
VGEGGDAVSLAAFIADQRTSHDVPHAVACRALAVSESWFYKWNSRQHQQTVTSAEQRRVEVDAAVAEAFEAAHGLHGSLRVHAFYVLRGGWWVRRRWRSRWPAKVWSPEGRSDERI